MKPHVAVLFAALVGSFPQVASAQSADKPTLSSITLNSSTNLIGEVRSENVANIVVFDLNTGEEKTLKKSDIKGRASTTETQAISRVGLPRFLAWRISKAINGPTTGKVAEVSPTTIYLTLGEKDGIEVGKSISAFRDDGDLKDPDTGNVIGKKRSKLAKLEVTEVKESYSKAKLLGELEVELKIGDLVEQDGINQAVAILPILDLNGDETTAGKALVEQITTVVVNRGISVVDRKRLDDTLNELALQQSKAFDQETAQKVGKQLGAVAILTGTITPKGNRAEAHVRLIRVETGEIIVAASQDLAGGGQPIPPTPQVTPGGSIPNASLDAGLLRKTFVGKATYNKNTSELQIIYDFRNASQLADFEVGGFTPKIANGMLLLAGGESIWHKAKFKTLRVQGEIGMNHFDSDVVRVAKDTGIRCRNVPPDFYNVSVLMFDEKVAGQEFIKKPKEARMFQFGFEVTEKRIGSIFERINLGHAVTAPISPCSIGLFGGIGGNAYRNLTIIGVPDPAWLNELTGMASIEFPGAIGTPSISSPASSPITLPSAVNTSPRNLQGNAKAVNFSFTNQTEIEKNWVLPPASQWRFVNGQFEFNGSGRLSSRFTMEGDFELELVYTASDGWLAADILGEYMSLKTTLRDEADRQVLIARKGNQLLFRSRGYPDQLVTIKDDRLNVPTDIQLSSKMMQQKFYIQRVAVRADKLNLP